MIRYPVLRISPLSSISRRSEWRLQLFRSFIGTGGVRGPLLNTIKHGHRELEAYYPHIIENKSVDERVRYQNLFVWELARNSVAKEMIVYPVLEDRLEEEPDAVRGDRERHQKIKEQLYQFQGLKSEDPNFESTFRSLFSTLEQQIKKEEERDLPQLEEKLDHDSLSELSELFERTKFLVPTRSHPSSPRSPPFETAAALLTAPIDKVVDIFRKFPKENGPMQ